MLKGTKHSPESLQKMKQSIIEKWQDPVYWQKLSKIRTGRKLTREWKDNIRKAAKERGFGKWMLGRKLSESTKQKIREKLKNTVCSCSTRFQKGHKPSEETILKGVIARNKLGLRPPILRGAQNNNWKGGVTPMRDGIKKSIIYKQWRKSVFRKDNFTCQVCGYKGRNIQAHHIISLSSILDKYNIKLLEDAINCKELWDISNGQTLCESCHQKTDNFGSKAI